MVNQTVIDLLDWPILPPDLSPHESVGGTILQWSKRGSSTSDGYTN
jgi:hypothetical protein